MLLLKRLIFPLLLVSLVISLPGRAAEEAQQPAAEAAVYEASEEVTYDDLDEQTLRQLVAEEDLMATFVLAMRLANGPDEIRDDVEAVRLFRKAAEEGIAVAQHNLGAMYGDGRGVPLDISQAAHWFRLAAEQGVAESMYSLGKLYGFEQWPGRDNRAAEYWLNKSLAQGFAPAQDQLDKLAGQAPGRSPEQAAAVAQPAPEPEPAGHGGLHDGKWILAQDPASYTLHIASMKTTQGARDFIRLHGMEKQAAYFVSKSSGKVWHSVIYGIYPSADAARVAAGSLPADIRNASPWVRKLINVHNKIIH